MSEHYTNDGSKNNGPLAAVGLRNKEQEEARQRGIGRLLLVDDDPQDLVNYSEILRQDGYEVRGLTSFDEAVVCVGREEYDLIVVSQGSRAFEGRSVLTRLAEKAERPPVLVLTRNVDTECYLEAMQLGALEYLEKPISPTRLGQAVKHYLRHGRHHT